MFGLKNLFSGGGDDKSSNSKKPPTESLVPNKKPSIGKTAGPARLAIPETNNEKIELQTIGKKPTAIQPKLDPQTSNSNTLNSKTNTTLSKGTGFTVSPRVDPILKGSSDIPPTSAIEEEIATTFSEGEDALSIQIIQNHLKQNNGKMEPRVWFMLMDIYQALGDVQGFDKTALSYAQEFGASPPSWFGADTGAKKQENMGGGKNIIILEQIMKKEYIDKFKELYKAAKKENFCRINVSQCKFEQNSTEILEKFLKLLLDLRKAKVVSVLMGDNNLISFCKKFIEDPKFKENLNADFSENEQLFWLIYLEVLQWKGQQEEFEKIAITFAEKFEISPPGWDDSGVMDLTKISKEHIDNLDSIGLDRSLNVNNTEPLLNFIKREFDKGQDAEVDMSNIDRIDFSAAGSISYHIQDLWSTPIYSNKKVILKHPNELIIILLHMVGVTEFVYIIPRNRK